MNAGVVIVNYNCASLALDAALSALGDDMSARVVIVDNGSTDHSVEYFRKVFADRRAHIPAAPENAPVACRFAEVGALDCAIIEEGETVSAQLTVLRTRSNRGFAAGSNLGMAYLEKIATPDWLLLLNPDALVAEGALESFVERLGDPAAGLCGASVLRFAAPHEAQAFGGAHLAPITLLGKNIGEGLSLKDAPSQNEVEARCDYPLGAAMALRVDYRAAYGDLDERYFLYYEEADWAMRARGRHSPVWARDAVVYHRHGAAAGSRRAPGKRAPFSDYHMARSRMLFALKHQPRLAPLIFVLSVAQALRRIARGHLVQARAVLNGVALAERRSSVPKALS